MAQKRLVILIVSHVSLYVALKKNLLTHFDLSKLPKWSDRQKVEPRLRECCVLGWTLAAWLRQHSTPSLFGESLGDVTAGITDEGSRVGQSVGPPPSMHIFHPGPKFDFFLSVSNFYLQEFALIHRATVWEIRDKRCLEYPFWLDDDDDDEMNRCSAQSKQRCSVLPLTVDSGEVLSGQQMRFYHRSEVTKHAKQSSADQDSELIHIQKIVVVNSNNTEQNLVSI